MLRTAITILISFPVPNSVSVKISKNKMIGKPRTADHFKQVCKLSEELQTGHLWGYGDTKAGRREHWTGMKGKLLRSDIPEQRLE